ncbi:MAG: tetratricopeptide repeat protein [Chloroflexota bacterium]|nr:tetratricopeptide repeat protein [Chloroflexota bacterium]
MAKNRKAFEEAMQAAANATWDKNWSEAATAYQRALAEFPRDVGALTGLAAAHFGIGQFGDALDAYQRASDLSPDDAALLERIGEIRKQLGQEKEAAEAYVASAERYQNQGSAHLALERWQDAVRTWPNCLPAHVQLLKRYQRQGQASEAVEECLILARIYQKQGRTDYAIQVCEYALKLAPHSPQVLTILESLRYDKRVAVEPEPEAPEEDAGALAAMIEKPLNSDILDFEAMPESETIEERGSPIDLARQKALSDLAESFFEEETETAPATAPRLNKAEIDALIGRAIDLQTQGKVEETIVAYEQVVQAGVDRPAAHFNLGLLYQDKLRFDAAISQFERTVSHSDYALGSHFALGECYRAKGRIDDALEHFIEGLKIVDLATVRREHADDLIQLYEHLADGYIAKGDREKALEFTNSLVTFLSEQGWEDKVIQARQRLDTLTEEGPILSLAEMLTVPGSDGILESMALSQEYAKRNMFYSALEECYYALDKAPTYIPIHRQLAQTLLAMGKGNKAVSKFVVIADAYLTQGNVHQALSIYNRALKLAPMNIAVRIKLIDTLISHGEIDEALTHYLNLADSYYQLAQMNQARETYQEALRLAPRGNPKRRWQVRILHKIGDIDMQHVDWQHAIEVYEQIRKLAPGDERAHLTLMELHYRLNQPKLAVAELDGLLRICREAGRTERIFAILEDAVHERSDSISLRARLAQAHLDSGNVEQALEHLDKLGDLQIEAERYEDAQATIRAIIMLRPPNVEAYQQLLNQLTN